MAHRRFEDVAEPGREGGVGERGIWRTLAGAGGVRGAATAGGRRDSAARSLALFAVADLAMRNNRGHWRHPRAGAYRAFGLQRGRFGRFGRFYLESSSVWTPPLSIGQRPKSATANCGFFQPIANGQLPVEGLSKQSFSRIENGHLPVAQQPDKLIRADYLLSTDFPLGRADAQGPARSLEIMETGPAARRQDRCQGDKQWMGVRKGCLESGRGIDSL